MDEDIIRNEKKCILQREVKAERISQNINLHYKCHLSLQTIVPHVQAQ